MNIKMNEVSKGTWLTAGGYVVELAEDRYATQETSPGTYKERPCIEWNSINKRGWFYDKNGFVSCLDDDWSEKLRLVEKLPFSLPELPSGYQWAGGYPQFRVPQNNDSFLGMRKDYTFEKSVYTGSNAVSSILGSRRLIVKKITRPEFPPPREQEMKPIPFVGPGQYNVVTSVDPTSVTMSLPVVETTNPSLLSRATSYFIIEPTKSIYRVARETAGHFVFLTAITAGGYACYNPSGVATFIKSCIPHVSISVEKPKVLK